jgi:hypothetical protein
LGVIGLFKSLILGRKLEMETNFPNYLTKAMLKPFGQFLKSLESFWTVLESKDAEAKPGLSQFEAEELLR